MSQRKMEGSKIIANAYKIVKPLFQVRSYMYAQVCCLKSNYEVATAALIEYVYENEDPSQTLKMLSEKLDMQGRQENANLLYPYQHVRDSFNDKTISLFFIRDYIVPFRCYQKKSMSVKQVLEILHGALSCLNHLHLRDIVHGNISLSTCYMVRDKHEDTCRFALNILDTAYFTEEDCFQGIEDRLFESQGQSLGLSNKDDMLEVSFKDDLESLVYVMTHLIGKGKVFTIQRFQLEWITEAEFLRWKTCEFFKEMIKIIPPELEILVEIYSIAKSLRRNEKPDYLKLMKKVIHLISNDGKFSKTLEDTHRQQMENSKKKSTIESVNEEEIVFKIDKLKEEPDRRDKVKERKATFYQRPKKEFF